MLVFVMISTIAVAMLSPPNLLLNLTFRWCYSTILYSKMQYNVGSRRVRNVRPRTCLGKIYDALFPNLTELLRLNTVFLYPEAQNPFRCIKEPCCLGNIAVRIFQGINDEIFFESGQGREKRAGRNCLR
jgi:hypothetical protein